VIAPNVRGSEGYGKAFLKLDNAEKREDSVKDIGALLDWIATQPDLDPARVVVHGGATAATWSWPRWSIQRPAGGRDQHRRHLELDHLPHQHRRLSPRSAPRGVRRRARPRHARGVRAISPLNNIGRVTKPMLVIQGANDPRVPESEADQVVAAIRQNGGDAWYLLARDEGHGFRKKQNTDVQREVETLFLKRVFGAVPTQTAAK
jgi:dipeptidyl aminopeptidase/acylaminoacyl peptidase